MSNKHILYISWQGAMGHVMRDLAIARELHRMNPELDISWMAHPLARKAVRRAGEKLLPESAKVADYNLAGLQAVHDFSFNLMQYARLYKNPAMQNFKLFKQVMAKYHFDLVVGDEIYGIIRAITEERFQLTSPIIMIEDFIGHQAMSNNPLEKLGAYLRNRGFVNAFERLYPQLTHLFIGEFEDVPDRRYGLFLPNRQEFAKKYYHFMGYIVRFDPAEYADKAKIRAKLGYGEGPLVICATGGTAAG